MRDRLMQWAIAGGAAGGVVAGSFLVVRSGSDVGNALAFLGGLVGAALAVLGAIWVEDRRYGLSRRRESRALVAGLQTDLAIIKESQAKASATSDDDSGVGLALMEVAAVVANAGDIPRAALGAATSLNFAERARLQRIVILADFVAQNTATGEPDDRPQRDATTMAADTMIMNLENAIAEIRLSR